jgi:hypothetical protein
LTKKRPGAKHIMRGFSCTLVHDYYCLYSKSSSEFQASFKMDSLG